GGPATLDAATRMASALVRSGGLGRGQESERTLRMFIEESKAKGPGVFIPARYWSVQAVSSDGEGQVRLCGAVLVRVRGRRPAAAPTSSAELSPELAAALSEPPDRPARALLGVLREDGALTPAGLMLALGAAAAGVV